MNDADVMSSAAYTTYTHNLTAVGLTENRALLDQLQSFLKANGAHSQVNGRKLPTDFSQGMETSIDSDGVRPSCRFCGKTFAQASYIKAHERLHTGEKPYVCSVCNKAFSDASNWKKHERMHSRQIQTVFEDGIVPIVTSAPSTPEPMSPSCSPTLSSVSHLSSAMSSGNFSPNQMAAVSVHLSSAPQLNSPMTTCHLSGLFAELSSGNVIYTQSGLSQNTHPSASNSSSLLTSDDSSDLSPSSKRSKDESLNCNLCGKVFSTPASLAMHKKIHTGEKPHSCETCGKSFTQIGTLRAHERVHTGEKPYECNICGKTFAQCGSFRMHERRHHRDSMENFQKCFICGASVASLEDLQKHLMCHPGSMNLNLQSIHNIHPGALCFPGPMPLGFGFHTDIENNAEMTVKNEAAAAEFKEIGKAFSLFASQPKSTPSLASSLADHFGLPPFVTTAHALIQQSLSQGHDPNTAAVSMLLASNGAENLNFLGHSLSAASFLPPARLPIAPPERTPSNISHDQNKAEEPEPVSTTTRSRKYSSDSHTSISFLDGLYTQSETKMKTAGEEENDVDNENGTSNCHKASSEDSSFAESQYMDDFQSDDQRQVSEGISRKNLNKRMISSSNLRKQRRPMRRLSTSALMDQSTYQQKYNEDGEENIDEEKIMKDQVMVSFLLSKGEVYKCKHCHIIFEDCTLYLLHNGFHANDTDPFKCVICKKSCDGRVEFNCHLTSHIK